MRTPTLNGRGELRLEEAVTRYSLQGDARDLQTREEEISTLPIRCLTYGWLRVNFARGKTVYRPGRRPTERRTNEATKGEEKERAGGGPRRLPETPPSPVQ